MNKQSLLRTIKRILSVPTASFHEQWLQAAILEEVGEYRTISAKFDRFGNLLLRYRPSKARAQVCFQAHLDHPGFVTVGGDEAEVLGNVPVNVSGASVRFFSSATSNGVPAKVVGDIYQRAGREYICFKSRHPVSHPSIGMWDLPSFKRVGNWLEGRSLDDNLSVAVLVYLLRYAASEGLKNPFDVLLTRAEEVGFVGTWALLKHKTFNDLSDTVINLEVPREYLGMSAGEGVVVRAADRNSFFDPKLLNFLSFLCEDLEKAERSFKFQKGLGLRGGIEATSFQLYGYQVASLCMAVQNGHNVGNRGRPAPERASLTDIYSLARLLQEIVTKKLDILKVEEQLSRRIESRFRFFAKDLKRSID